MTVKEVVLSECSTTTPTSTTKDHRYPVKSIVINICSSLYREWASRKRIYSKAINGLTVKVDYADTAELCESSSNSTTTILALHGAPGSHEDFEPFIEYFGSKAIRIIVPNFPGINQSDYKF